MKNILIVNSSTYAQKQGGGAIADISEVNELVPGALAAFDDDGNLIASSATDLDGIENIILASGTKGVTNNISVPIVLKTVNHLDFQAVVAPVKQIVVVGGTTSTTSIPLADSDEGEVFINVYDKTFTSRFPMNTVKASVYKTASMTAEQVIDKLVAKLNNPDSFVNAGKSGASPDFRIGIAPKEFDVSLSVGVGGLIESCPVYTDGTNGSAIPVSGVGQGEMVAKLERDFNVFKGDSGFIEREENWWGVPTETDITKKYTSASIMWTGLHDTPTTTKAVMNNLIIVACETGSAGSTFMSNLITLLKG